MAPPNDFWLSLHRLEAAFEAEGSYYRERIENIVLQFRGMPRAAQRQLMSELVRTTTDCTGLFSPVLMALKECEVAGERIATQKTA
jgi:hypothetical protein